MKALRLSADLTLPLEAVTQKFAFLGKNGSGKTYGASKLAELMLDAGAQIVALDPVGVWYGLRLAADGKAPGIRIPVFGGLYGDLPLELTAGALIADVIVDRAISAVIDVSQFEYDTDKTKFCTDFARRLFHRKKAAPSAIHLFLEEAQEFLPQNPQRGEERMLHEMTRIGKVGRNHGFGWTLITPRPQEVNKKALNLTEVVLAFQTNGTHERKAIAEWVKEKGQDVDVVEILPKLKPGHAHAWSPSWLEISEEIHIAEKRTFNASATPKVGATAVEARPLAPIDLEKLKLDMAATIEKKKAEDPVELKKQLAERDRRIRQLASAKPGERVVTKPVVDQAAIDRAVAHVRKQYNGFLAQIAKSLETSAAMAARIPDRIAADLKDIADFTRKLETERPADAAGAGAERRARQSFSDPVPPALHRPAVQPRDRIEIELNGNGTVSGVQQRILNTIQGFASLGIDEPDKATVAALVGYHPNAKSYSNAIGGLRTSGYIEYPAGGRIRLTEQGSVIAEDKLAISTVDELHEVWFDKLGGVAKRILTPLLAAYPDPVEADVVAGNAGYHPNAKSFSNMKGRLRTLGLIDYPRPGMMAATNVLFPEGLS